MCWLHVWTGKFPLPQSPLRADYHHTQCSPPMPSPSTARTSEQEHMLRFTRQQLFPLQLPLLPEQAISFTIIVLLCELPDQLSFVTTINYDHILVFEFVFPVRFPALLTLQHNFKVTWKQPTRHVSCTCFKHINNNFIPLLL